MADSEMVLSSIGYHMKIKEAIDRVYERLLALTPGSIDLAPLLTQLQQINAKIIMPTPVSLDPLIELGKMQVERLDKIIELLGH